MVSRKIRIGVALSGAAVMVGCGMLPGGGEGDPGQNEAAISSATSALKKKCKSAKGAAQCDDHDPCTLDACVEELCRHDPAPYGAACASKRNGCDAEGVCDGHGRCVEPGEPLWSVVWPVDGSLAVGTDITDDRAGGALVTGGFDGSIDLGGGPIASAGERDALVVKLDPARGVIWSRRFGGPDYQMANRVAVDGEGDIIIAGELYGTVDFGTGPITSAGLGDIFVVKLDAAGTTQWVRRFGDPAYQYVRDMDIDAEGNVILAGTFEGAVDFGDSVRGAGGQDVYLLKLDPAGNTLWSRSFGDISPQEATGVAVGPGGDVLVAGWVNGTIDLGGGPLQAPSGAFVAKFDATGAHVWSKLLDDANLMPGDVAVDGAGDVLFAGQSLATVDIGTGPVPLAGFSSAFVAKLDPSGAALWARSFGAPGGHAWAGSIAADSAGNIVLAGEFFGSIEVDGTPLPAPAAGGSAFVVKLGAGVGAFWIRALEAPGVGASVGADDRVLVTGRLTGTIDTGAGPLTGDGDIFAAAFGP